MLTIAPAGRSMPALDSNQPSAFAREKVAVFINPASGSAEMVRLLLNRRAPPDMAEARNWTALSFAAQQGFSEVVDALIAADADVGWRTAAGF